MGVKAEAAVDTGAGVTILDTQLCLKWEPILAFFITLIKCKNNH